MQRWDADTPVQRYAVRCSNTEGASSDKTAETPTGLITRSTLHGGRRARRGGLERLKTTHGELL